MGKHDEGDVAVPAGERASLEVVQAEAGLELAVVVFSVPPVMYLNQVIPSHLR